MLAFLIRRLAGALLVLVGAGEVVTGTLAPGARQPEL